MLVLGEGDGKRMGEGGGGIMWWGGGLRGECRKGTLRKGMCTVSWMRGSVWVTKVQNKYNFSCW